MKNKIKQFAKGEFKLEKPDIVFDQTHIQISVGEGEVYQGSFLIENKKEGNIRGLVYPSSFRIHCLEQGFDANPVKVNFTYDPAGLLPGQIEMGKFAVVCNGGEFDLDFTAVVEKPFVMTSYGKVQTLEDFRRLAMKDFGEAKCLFRTRRFYDILRYEDLRVRNLYDNMRKWSLDEEALEEFLVGVRQKEKIFLTLSREKLEYENILEEKKDWIDIAKNTWGYAPIRVRTQGDFLRISQNEFTTEDFIGSNFRLEYILESKKLHVGHNYGKIWVETPYETLSLEIDVQQRGRKSEDYGVEEMILGQALKEYLQFISGKTDRDTWVENALAHVGSLRERKPESEYYMLLQAHIYLRGARAKEAGWILENGNFGKFVIGRKPEITAYYQFLNALLKKDNATLSRALEDIERLYIKHPYSWQLLCMLINLDPKYRDYGNRMRVLERQFFNGARQVLLYAEAYICLQEKVILLRKLESFEIQVLNFATKYQMITKELAIRAADLISQQKKYNRKLLHILERAYGMYEDPAILNALCKQLILGNRADEEAFLWYEKAVKKELRIARLYEYYMMSIPEKAIKEPLPKTIYLYFMHGISLDDAHKAMLYENVVSFEEGNSEIYKAYEEEIEQFIREQLKKRQVNDSLRILYSRFLEEESLSFEEIDAVYDICHKYKVTTNQKGMKYVLVIEKDGSIRQRAAYTDRGAYVYLYNKEARIVWEASDGRHYTDSFAYETVRLFYEMRFLEICRKRMQGRESAGEEKKAPLNFENLKLYGIDTYGEEDVFLLCSKRIREQEDVEDDFLLYISFSLLKRGFYDRALLTYLAHFFCGATGDMKYLWRKAKEYGVKTGELSERIITQMLFSEVMFGEYEIFEDYYVAKPYFRLKQAYLAYASYLYVAADRKTDRKIFTIIMRELQGEEYLADICRAAILKYFAGKDVDRETAEILQGYLKDLCGKGLVFAFYQQYPREWRREVQLYDKYLVEHRAKGEENCKITYRMNGGEMSTEVLLPVYEDIFVKEFILFDGETLEYTFSDKEGKGLSDGLIRYVQPISPAQDGKYGRLNGILALPKEGQIQAMQDYRIEEELAQEIFKTC